MSAVASSATSARGWGLKIPFPKLQIEQRIEIGGVSHTYLKRVTEGLVFRNDVTGEAKTHDGAALVHGLASGNVVLVRQVLGRLRKGIKEKLAYDLDHFDDKQQRVAMARAYLILAFERTGLPKNPKDFERVIRIWSIIARHPKIRSELGNPIQCCWTTLRGWMQDFLRSGRNFSALVRLDENKGRRPETFAPVVMDIVAKTARRHYLIPTGVSIAALEELVRGQVRAVNDRDGSSHAAPTARQLPRLISDIATPSEWMALVEGNRAERRAFSAKRRRKSLGALMEVIEVDHVLMDCIAVRERTGEPLETEEDAPPAKKGLAGRVWATVAICQRSRCIVGWHLTLDPPSATSVMRCLKHVMTAKPDLDLGDGVVVPNPVWGKPKTVHVDNGRDFHSKSLALACMLLKIRLQHMGKRRPWDRGRIERLFRDLHREVDHTAPGSTFSDPISRGDYDSEGMARLTLERIKRRFEVWAVARHRHSEHRALGRATPAETWNDGADTDVEYPTDSRSVSILTRRVLRNAQLRDIGIEHLGLQWTSGAFEDLLGRKGPGKKYVVTVDPTDLRSVTLIEDTETGPIFHTGYLDRPELVEGLDYDLWTRVYRRGRQRTPAAERVRQEVLYLALKELLSDASERDRRGEKLPRVVAKFADAAARREAVEAPRAPTPAPAKPPPAAPPPRPDEVPSPVPATPPPRGVAYEVPAPDRSVAHRALNLA